MSDRLLQLSRSTGGVRNPLLSNWSLSFAELCTALSSPPVGEKDGSYFVRGPVIETGKRGDANITSADVIILDGDSRIESGNIEEGAPPPELIHDVLRGLDIQHLIYTSYSHQGAALTRFRVVVPSDRPLINKDELASCVDWLIQKLHANGVGLNSVKENYTWSQPWYFPRLRNADAPFQVLVHAGGARLEVNVCLAEMPATPVSETKAKPRANAKPVEEMPLAATDDAQTIVQVEPIADTTDVVPAESAAPNPPQSEEDLQLQELLAAAPGVNEDEREGKDGKMSPIADYIYMHGLPHDMMYMLKEHGYIPAGHATVNGKMAFRLKAPNATSDEPGVVLFQTLRGVWRAYSHHGAHDPLSHKAEDAFGLLRIFKYGGNLDKALESIGIFKRKITHAEVCRANPKTEAGRLLIKAYRKQITEDFNAKYGLLLLEGKAVIVSREINHNTGVVETNFAEKTSIKTYYENIKLPKIIKNDNEEYALEWGASVFQEWLKSPDRRSYPQTLFAPVPKLPATTAMPESGQPYKLYVGTNLLPRQGDCTMILDHIHDIWCRGNIQVYDYVISWLARMIQKPGEQGKTVIALRSGEGTGKNIIFDIFDRYFGCHSVMLSKPEDLVGFNDHLGIAVFVFLNEALWGGNKSVEGTIKSTITDDILHVERKHIPKFKCRNCTHIVVATNNDWAVPVGIDDRRFFILDTSEERKGDFEYFTKLADHIHSGGQEAFLYHLENEVSIEGFDVRKIPELHSATKLDHKIRTADSITKWWIDILVEGGFDAVQQTTNDNNTPCKEEIFIEWKSEDPLHILRQDIYESYLASTRGTHRETATTLTKKLAELLGVDAIETTRPWSDGGARQRFLVLPSLQAARLAMEEKLRQRGPWHDVVDVSSEVVDQSE